MENTNEALDYYLNELFKEKNIYFFLKFTNNNMELAKDLRQDVALKLTLNKEKLFIDEENKPFKFISYVTRNEFINYTRFKSKRRDIEHDIEVFKHVEPITQEPNEDYSVGIGMLLDKFISNDEQRTILGLHIDNVKLKEISIGMGIKYNNTSTLKRRGYKLLKRKMVGRGIDNASKALEYLDLLQN